MSILREELRLQQGRARCQAYSVVGVLCAPLLWLGVATAQDLGLEEERTKSVRSTMSDESIRQIIELEWPRLREVFLTELQNEDGWPGWYLTQWLCGERWPSDPTAAEELALDALASGTLGGKGHRVLCLWLARERNPRAGGIIQRLSKRSLRTASRYLVEAVSYYPSAESDRVIARGLTHRSALVRESAAWSAGRCGNPQFIDSLRALLVEERSSEQFMVAGFALRRMAYQPLFDELLQLIKRPGSWMAWKLLGGLFPERASPVLREYLQHGQPLERAYAAEGLEHVNRTEASAALVDAVETETYPVLVNSALTSLANCGTLDDADRLLAFARRIPDLERCKDILFAVRSIQLRLGVNDYSVFQKIVSDRGISGGIGASGGIGGYRLWLANEALFWQSPPTTWCYGELPPRLGK